MVNVTLYGIRSHHFKYFLNSLILLQSILRGDISQMERYKYKLLNRNTQQYLICLLECLMKRRNVHHKCIDYFINSVKNYITKNRSFMLINRRYLLSIRNEFEKKLLDILFETDNSLGCGPFIEYCWREYHNDFKFGFSSLQYFKGEMIKLNIHPTHLRYNGNQYKIVKLSENDPTFKIGFYEQDNELRVKLSVVKMNSIRGIQMKEIVGYCYISIAKSQISPTMISINGGINECLNIVKKVKSHPQHTTLFSVNFPHHSVFCCGF